MSYQYEILLFDHNIAHTYHNLDVLIFTESKTWYYVIVISYALQNFQFKYSFLII